MEEGAEESEESRAWAFRNQSDEGSRVMLTKDLIMEHLQKIETGSVNFTTEIDGNLSFRGISRKANPENPIWKIFDTFGKDTADEIIKVIEGSTKGGNFEKYWDEIYGDEWGSLEIASLLFQFAVLRNPTDAIRCIQRTSNVVNARVLPLVVDGKFGNQTWLTVDAFWKEATQEKREGFLAVLRSEMIQCLIDNVSKEKLQKYLAGWARRFEMFPPTDERKRG